MESVESLKEKLFLNKKNGWEGKTEEEKKEIFKFSDEYMLKYHQHLLHHQSF